MPLASVLGALVLLAGCQFNKALNPQQALSAPERIEGRISITGLSATPGFRLERGQGGRQIFRASGLLGMGEISVTYVGGEPLEGRFQGKRLSADELQQTLTLNTGLAVPLAVLPAWLQGQADPRWPSSSSPDGFKQLGWLIRRVLDTRVGTPKRIELTSDDLKVVVGIRRWE